MVMQTLRSVFRKIDVALKLDFVTIAVQTLIIILRLEFLATYLMDSGASRCNTTAKFIVETRTIIVVLNESTKLLTNMTLGPTFILLNRNRISERVKARRAVSSETGSPISILRSSMRVLHAAIKTTVISRSFSVLECGRSTIILSCVSELEKTDISAAISLASYSADLMTLATSRSVLANCALAPARVMREAVNPMISAITIELGFFTV